MRPLLLVRAALLATTLAAGACAAGAAPVADAPAAATRGAARDARGVVLLVRTPRHLQAALATAEALRAPAPAGAPSRPVRIIACGDAIGSLLRGAEAEPRVRSAVDRGVAVVACGMTLDEKGIDPARVSSSVTVVPNGLVEAVRLQDAGYVSVEL